jgi:tetratricopeptide (TPR) repeat protein
VPEDADLELAIALDEARSNLPDSAWARLNGPVLSAALADTGGPPRWRDYPFQREPFWLSGRFDGWYWYIARARAEVALRLQRWDDALEAARRSAYARPLAGKEHLLLALCLAHAGHTADARLETARAVQLDPMLPEAHYLDGLLAWRTGDRAGARASFRAALAGDSLYRAPALALSRLLVPGLAPDPLPTSFLSGIRRAAELTSRVRPKLEEYVQYDQLATLYGLPTRAVPESLQRVMGMTKPIRLYVTVLVDERGRVVLNELPWMPSGAFPEVLLEQVLRDAMRWNFRPAYKLGQPRASLASVEYQLTL